MTENAPFSGQGTYDPLSMAGLLDSSLRPGGSISLTFSDRILSLTRSLEDLGFFQAAEQGGMVYHLWTSALKEHYSDRSEAEETLLRVLKFFQSSTVPSYIG